MCSLSVVASMDYPLHSDRRISSTKLNMQPLESQEIEKPGLRSKNIV